MNKIKIKLENEINSNFQDMNHHPNIQEYINNLNKYFNIRTPLQYISHSIEKSKIKFQTNMGSITCSLLMGSILLYIKDTPLSITELVEKTNINENNIRNKLDILCMNDILICMEDGVHYKYIEPFGDVDCFDNFSNFKAKTEKQIVMNRFTDIVMTIESRIIKEIKPNKMNIMELERRVQEYAGESYIRSIFYQRIESLKKRYLIEEKDSIIEYSV
jgi:DNA-binding transcriptional regulator GbsR (MarR family)